MTSAWRVAAKHRAHASDQRVQKLRLGLQRRRHTTPGESELVKLLAA